MKKIIIFIFLIFLQFWATFAYKIHKVDYIVWSFFFNIKWKYYRIEDYYYTKLNQKTIKYYWKDKNNVLIINNWIVYLTTKDKIHKINFNPIKKPEYHFKNSKFFIPEKDILYVKKEKKHITWTIAKRDKRFFYLIFQGKYEIYDKKNYTSLYIKLLTLKKNKLKLPIIINYQDKYYVYDNVRIFYIWNNLKNININKLWEILFTSFLIRTKHNLPYSYKELKQIIVFAKYFKWRWLINLYKYMQRNFKYNKQILQTREYNKNTSWNWDLFYVFRNKTWVCKWFSDLFSLIALFNWFNADIVVWKLKESSYWDSIYHQVSKINWKYYDITSDLDNKEQNYFAMSKDELLKYFSIEEIKIKNKE